MNSSFTEHILERARQRQRKIEELNTSENIPTRKRELITSPIRNTSITSPIRNISSEEKQENKGMEHSTPEEKKFIRMPSIKESVETNNAKSPMKISSHIPGSPQTQLKTLNIQKENFNMEIKLVSADNVRVEVEIQSDEESDKENTVSKEENVSGSSNGGEGGLREHAKYKLKKLGKLYSADENEYISSPIQNSEAYFSISENHSSDKSQRCSNIKSKKGLSKLADLAQNIRDWEDNITVKKVDNSTPDSQENNTNTKSTITSYNKTTNSPSKNYNATKKVEWDEDVLKALESQGFTRSESKSRLVYNCNSPSKLSQQNKNLTIQKIEELAEPQTSKSNNNPCKPSKQIEDTCQNHLENMGSKSEKEKPAKRSIEGKINSGIQSKKALFEKSSPMKQHKSEVNMKDPSMLSIADRKALFEKNKGEALVPKAAFAMSIPLQQKEKKQPVNMKNKFLSKFQSNVEERATDSVDTKADEKVVDRNNISKRIEALIENRVEKNTTASTIQQEIESVRNRFNKNKNLNNKLEQGLQNVPENVETQREKLLSPKKTSKFEKEELEIPEERRTRRSSDSPQVKSVLESVKNIKVLTPKDGRLYPALSDIETATENENEQMSENSMNDSCEMSDVGDTSFGREILEVVCKNQAPRKRSMGEASSDSNISGVLDDLDDYLLDNNSEFSEGPTPPKKLSNNMNNSGVKPCNSFHYKSFTSETKSPTKILTSPKAFKSTRVSTDLPTHVVDGESVMPLHYTVSFYRKQQMQVNTPAKKIIHQSSILEADEGNSEDELGSVVKEKIRTLTEEINKQQMIISQTSQALNLCNSTLEFMGSTEQVEAEKLLLLATNRRQAAIHEIQRLKIQGTLRPQDQHARNLPLEKGSLAISNIKLPLKREYVRALAAAGGKGHHVICLVKSNEQVVSSQLISTVATSVNNPDTDLTIPGKINLDNIYSDFAVTFEVYCLQAQEEILPHDVKYHINKKASNKLTPRKGKQESRMIVPPKESPAGPQAVRSSSFALMGYVVFSIQTVNKMHFSLNNAPSMSPLEGRVDMKISCELAVSSEHKGFLTMFEDISGFGAWHRRWCVLRGDLLSYWKYPDQEKEKPAIGSISLKNCITENVVPVNREVCARLNTFLIEIMREPEVGDKESLTLYRKNNKIVVRHLLSADTKDERIKWCEMFNKALIAIRMWGKK